jgi:hypothetical protein
MIMEDNLKETPTENQPSDLFSDVFDTSAYEASMRSARNWLYWIAAIQMALGIYEYYRSISRELGIYALIVQGIIAIVFFLLALWSKKSPVLAFTTALIFYVLIILGLALINPTNIFSGAILKVLVIIALIRANRDSRKYEAIKSSL